MNKEHIIPAVEKTLALVEFLGQSETGATQAELAKKLQLASSTCYRIIQTLQKHDWVHRVGGNRFDLAGGVLSAAMKLMDQANRFKFVQPWLEGLAERSGFSCKLSVRQGNEQLTILRAEADRPMVVTGKVGARFPVIEGTVGAALLCAEPEAEILALAEGCKTEIPEKTRPQLVLERIAEIGRRGGCGSDGRNQNRWQVDAWSCPVRDGEGRVVAALTALGFPGEFAGSPPAELTAQLLAAAAQIAQAL